MTSPEQTQSPGPGLRDWALFTVALVFVAIGLLMLRDKPREALLPLTFFGACLVSFGYKIVRKMRRRRFIASSVSVPGGVKLRGSRQRTLLTAALIAVPAVAIFLVPAPVYIYACAVVMLAASAWLVYAVTTGRISGRFLRFDPPGLTVGEPGYEYFVPWDAITDITEFEMVDNASVGVTVSSLDTIEVAPPGMRARVLKGLANNAGLSGHHVVFMAAHYDVPAEALAAAIRNYARNPQARFDLVPNPALNAPSPPR